MKVSCSNYREDRMPYTHALQYQQRDGSWKDGHLAYAATEAKGVAREGQKRTGRKVRVVQLPAKG